MHQVIYYYYYFYYSDFIHFYYFIIFIGNQIDNKTKNQKKRNTASKFDERNEDTFGISTTSQGGENGSTNETGWTVQEMFETNARLTGQRYSYDGNPHNFGSTHPQYVNYNTTTTGSTPTNPIKITTKTSSSTTSNIPITTTTTTNNNNNTNNNHIQIINSSNIPTINAITTSTPTNNNNNNNNSRQQQNNQKQNLNNQQQQQQSQQSLKQQQHQNSNNPETILQNKTIKVFSNLKNEKLNQNNMLPSNKNYFNLPFSFNSNLVMQQVNKVLRETEE